MSTHNICSCQEMRKYLYFLVEKKITLSSRAMSIAGQRLIFMTDPTFNEVR